MIGRLTRYELKKILSGKFFIISLVLLLILNVALSFPEEGYWTYFGQKRKVADQLRPVYEALGSLTPGEREEFHQAMLDKYGENAFTWDPEVKGQMSQIPGYFGGQFSDSDYADAYQETQSIRDSRDSTLQRVISAAKENGKVALKEGDSYQIRRNLQIIRLYSLPRPDVKMPVQGCWSNYLFNTRTMIFALLMILYVCAGIFSKEIDQQSWLLLQTAKNGKGKTMAAKFLAAGISGAALTALFFGTSLAVNYLNLGFQGIGESVSGLQGMEMFPYPITVGQYALLSLACQIFAGIVMALILSALSAFCKNSVIAYCVGFLAMVGFLELSFFPPKSNWLAGPLALSQPWKYLDTYRTANFFGYPVLWAVVEAVLFTVLTGVLMAVSYRVHYRKRSRI